MARRKKDRKQRSHTPHRLGPRVWKRGRYQYCDLRPWGGPKTVMRNPKAEGWPAQGDKTEDEDIARKWAWEYVAYYRDGIRRNLLGLGPRPKKLKDATQEFLDHRAVIVEPNTWSSDRTAVAHLIEWFTESAKTTDITSDGLQKLVNERLRAGYAVGSMRTFLTSVGPFMKFVGLDGIVGQIVLPKRAKADVHAWTDSELKRIRKAADYVSKHYNERDWPNPRKVLEFFLASGCRQQEGFAAEEPRVDKRENTVRLTHQLDRNTNELRMLKGKEARTVLLLPEYFDDGWYDPKNKGFVLGKPNGKPLGYRSQVNLLTRILDAAQLKTPRVAYHSLRHTYARLFLERGASLEMLQEMLGHKSIKTTEEDYKHFTSDVASRLARQRIYGLRAV